MEKLQFIINKKVELTWEKETFKSSIEDFGDKFFSISIPTKDGEYVSLKAGDEVEVLYYTETSVYQFDTIVIGRKIETIPVILLEVPKNFKVIQRREYFRVNKVDYLEVANLDKTSLPANIPTQTSKKAMLVDLSGGGMKIKLKDNVQIGDIIHFFLKTNKDNLELYGKVVRVEIDESKLHVCGVSFLDLNKIEREKIIQYTFEIMRAQRSKAL